MQKLLIEKLINIFSRYYALLCSFLFFCTTSICERVVERECANCPDSKIVDNTKSVIDIEEKITHNGLGESHIRDKTVIGEPIAIKDRHNKHLRIKGFCK